MMLQLGDERSAWAKQRLRCVTSELSLDCSTGTPARSELVIRLGSALVALPTAHFERNDVTIICETVH